MKEKIVYILSYPRSGSTLVGSLIAEAMDIIHVGETFFIWKEISDGIFPDRMCGCKRSMADCNYWSQVITDSFQEFYNSEGVIIDNYKLFKERESLFSRVGYKSLKAISFQKFTKTFYRQIFEKSKRTIIVDSSKELSYAKFLWDMNSYEIFYIYLVRDPRGVLLSRQRKLKEVGKRKVLFNYVYLLYDVMMILLKDVFITWFLKKKRHFKIRYEDFVANPSKTLSDISLASGVPITRDIFENDKSVTLSANHIAVGNKIKFITGKLNIYLDERWRKDMRTIDKIIIKVLMWFFFLKYNY